jgi:DNA (cytosine-5)-methyltransferase 1
MQEIKEFVIDLFCGAGGTSEGIKHANKNVTVIACVNHDAKAIASHKLNHPNATHYVEDIRNPEVVFFLSLKVKALRKLYPNCIISIWASLECTNFSNAKGGLPRDADSRTLAEHLFMYLDDIDPDYLMIENVQEFMSWGPLDDKGKPVSRKRGVDYIKWVNNIQNYGYDFDYRILNAADYGGYTIRKRYFAQFAKVGLPISWPVATHSKNPDTSNSLFAPLKKWKAVKEVLDFSEEGKSIFNRKKPLVENTLKRIYAGLVKFVANGDDSFIQKYYSDKPAGSVTTSGNQSLIETDFILKYNSVSSNGKHVPPSIEDPAPTVAAQSRLGKVFLQSYYGNGQVHSIEDPSGTIGTKDTFSKVKYIMLNYSNGSNVRSIETPAGTIVNNDKHNIVNAFLYNPQFSNKGNAINIPCPVIIARQDKKPLSIVVCDHEVASFAIPIYEDDNPTMVLIKKFMAYYGITDIKMRMLLVKELLQIQGFPADYKLVGTQTDQKKFIGNSVERLTATALFNSHYVALKNHFNQQFKNIA